MLSAALLIASALAMQLAIEPRVAPDTARAQPAIAIGHDSAPPPARWVPQLDTPRVRPRAVEYSDWYARRLAIHRIGSYTMLPLFAAEYALGDRLLNGTNVASWVKPAHATVAGGVATLFTVNTVTGVWNLWDSRHDPAGGTRKWLHAGLLLASDAGFAWTGVLAGDANKSPSNARRHRNVAVGSMALSTVGTALMWFWKD
jgi:hypothetical protein